jgi:formate/nitrite transporter FocA (FNT family)
MADAYAPKEIAARVRDVGVGKASLDLPSMFALAVLAGAFIGLGACFSTLAVSGFEGSYGIQRVVAGLTFSLGLVLVVLAGAPSCSRATTSSSWRGRAGW